MSDFDDLRDDAAAAAPAAHPGEADAALSVAGDSTAAAPVNPRKRKKSSRASVLLLPCLPFYSYQTPQLLSCSVLSPDAASLLRDTPQPSQPLPTTTLFPQSLAFLTLTGVEYGCLADLSPVLAVTSAM